MLNRSSLEKGLKAPELTADGRNREDLSPMERRFMEATEGRSVSATNQVNIGGPGAGLPGWANSTAPGMTQMEKDFRQALGMEPNPMAVAVPGTAGSLVPPGSFQTVTPSQAEMQRREAFMQILDSNNSRPAAKPGSIEANPFATRYVDSTFYDPPKPVAPPPVTPPASMGLGAGLDGSSLAGQSASIWSTPPPVVQPPVRSVAPPVSPFGGGAPRRTF
jgi:hypothetical protein